MSAKLTLVPPRIAQRNQLVEEYLPLVKMIARNIMKRLPASFELDDLVSEGTIGLMQAAERFEPGRGVPFRAFAAKRVRGQIIESVRRRNWRDSNHLPITQEVTEMESHYGAPEAIMGDIEQEQRARIIEDAVQALPAREQKVVEIYFRQERQLAGIGHEFHVRESRSSQILQMTKRSLKREIGYRGLRTAA